MSKEIANTDLSISITPSGAATWTPGTPTYTKISASGTKCSNKSILCNQIIWVMVPASCTQATPPAVHLSGAGSMAATAGKVKAKALGTKSAVMRKDDSGTCTGVFTVTGPPPIPQPCSCTFKITDAGQTKVKAE